MNPITPSDSAGGASPFRETYPPGTQLNWIARYRPMKPYLSAAATASVLEVGCGHIGLASIVHTPFVGIEIDYAAPPTPQIVPFSYDGGRLPFADRSFHTVVSNHVLEHVPPAVRASFIGELARVASTQVLIGFPADEECRRVDAYVARIYPALFKQTPSWLFEHQEHGIPDSSAIERLFAALAGWSYTRLPMTSAWIDLMLFLADAVPGVSEFTNGLLADHAPALETWMAAGTLGPTGNRLYRLGRKDPSAASVDVSRWSTIARAFECPACSAPGVDQTTTTLGCSRCGRTFARTPERGFDVRGVIRARPAPSRGRTHFVLAPSTPGGAWLASVRAYLDAFSADAPTCLWLRATGGITAAAVVEALGPLVSGYGDKPFADIHVTDDNADQPPTADRAVIVDASVATDSAFFARAASVF